MTAESIQVGSPQIASEEGRFVAQVVACFKGKGRVGDTQHWCAGRLWRYADGDIGFLWLPGNDHDG